MIFIISDSDAEGLSINKISEPITSDRLCGAMFVAIPTAIPDEPLTKSPGRRPGRTEGSCKEPS